MKANVSEARLQFVSPKAVTLKNNGKVYIILFSFLNVFSLKAETKEMVYRK
jgi:hypothetical protein